MSNQNIISTASFIAVFFFLLNGIAAQNVHIKGTASGNPDKLVRIIAYEDQFSKLEKTVASTYTDKTGKFEMDFEINQIDFVHLSMDIKRGEFYISPNSEYDFVIIKDSLSQRGSIFDELPLQFSYEADDDKLSDNLTAFNIHYNNFLYKNGNKIYKSRDKQFIRDFEKRTNDIFQSEGNAYFNNYVKYSLGWLEWISKTKNDSLILAHYFIGKPILYHNIQYTEFLSEFSKSYFGYNKIFDYDELVTAINTGNSFEHIVELVSRDVNLAKDQELTELLAILILTKKYYSADTKKDKAIMKLEEVGGSSNYATHRAIAHNYVKKLTHLEIDTKAPDFSLIDQSGKKVSLDDLSGKLTLISFVKPDCNICEEHFQMLDEIEESLYQKVQLVTIVYGENYSNLLNYANDRSYDWPFLKLNDILLLEAYNIRTYPTYVIVYPDGTMAMSTAPMPDENLDLYLQRHYNRFKEINGDK